MMLLLFPDIYVNSTTSRQYSEEAFASAMTKLTQAATLYNASGAGAVGLQGFEAVTILPHELKVRLEILLKLILCINFHGIIS